MIVLDNIEINDAQVAIMQAYHRYGAVFATSIGKKYAGTCPEQYFPAEVLGTLMRSGKGRGALVEVRPNGSYGLTHEGEITLPYVMNLQARGLPECRCPRCYGFAYDEGEYHDWDLKFCDTCGLFSLWVNGVNVGTLE